MTGVTRIPVCQKRQLGMFTWYSTRSFRGVGARPYGQAPPHAEGPLVELLILSLYTALVSSVIVGTIFAYLYALEGDPHTGMWTLGMFALGGAFLTDVLAYTQIAVSRSGMGAVVTSTLAAVFFTEGALRLRGMQSRLRALGVLGMAAVAATLFLPTSPLWLRLLPSGALLTTGLGVSAWLVFHTTERAGNARYMVASSLAALAGMAAIHPLSEWVYAREVLHVDYLWAGVFVVSLGVGVLFMHVREYSARLTEQGSEVALQAAVLNQVGDGILGLDLELKVTVWSAVCERMYGISAGEVLGRHVAEVLPGEFMTARPDVVFRRLLERGSVAWTMRYRDADGCDIYHEVSGSSMTDEAGTITGFVAAIRDVTERFKFQIEIDEGRQRYRTLFESSPIPLWEEDFSAVKVYLDELKASGVEDIERHLIENPLDYEECMRRIRIIDVNDATVQMYRADSKEQFLASVDLIAHPDFIPVFAAEFAALAAGATRHAGEIRSWTLDGEELTIAFIAAVPPGYEDTLGRVLVSDMNLTEYRKAQRELQRLRTGLESDVERKTKQLSEANAQLWEAMVAKDRLLANVSHEMRTPLNSIIGFTGVVAQGLTGEVSEEAKRQLNMANRSGKQLLALVNDLLDLHRFENGQVQLDSALVDVEELVHSTCEIVRPFARDKGLLVTCEVTRLPEVRTDEDRVRQVLLNLLSNAVKYTDEGSVKLSARAHKGELKLSVADTGKGIAQDDLERVFEAFHQLAPTREAKHTGAGLGLAISREIAELLGGTLTVTSAPGEGSVFTLALPLEREVEHSGSSA